MNIPAEFKTKHEEVFYDKNASICTVTDTTSDIGQVTQTFVVASTIKCGIQPSVGTISMKEFGKQFENAFRLSCAPNLIQKGNVILYAGHYYDVIEIGNWDSHQVVMITRKQNG